MTDETATTDEAQAAPQDLESLTQVGDSLYDADGTWVAFMPPPAPEGKPGEFTVDSQGAAEWVMGKMMDAEAVLLAVEAQETAILANLHRIRKREQERIEWLKARFGAQLEAFADANLPKRSGTWTCAYGSVAFRTVPGGLKAKDTAQALGWARRECPAAVVTSEEFKISKVEGAARAGLINDVAKLQNRMVEVERARELMASDGWATFEANLPEEAAQAREIAEWQPNAREVMMLAGFEITNPSRKATIKTGVA